MHASPSMPPGGMPYEVLDELYDVWCAEVTQDIPFYCRLVDALATELGRPSLDVVELGAGSGRISVALATHGHQVTAIDASARQLARLETAAAAADVAAHVHARVGDLCLLEQLIEPASADLVLAPFRTLLHVTPDRLDVLRAAFESLRPGGVLAFDVFHPTAEQIGITHGRWLHRRTAPTRGGRWRFDERARYLPEAAAEAGGLKLEVDVRCRWRRSRRGRHIPSLTLADPVDDATAELTALLELQLIPAERWRQSLLEAGFELDGCYGWFDGRALEVDDEDSIWVARRPAAAAGR